MNNNIELEDEIWTKVKFAPAYSVSNYGNIRMDGKFIIDSKGIKRYYKPHFVKFNTKKTGYLEVSLITEVNTVVYALVHRVVLSSFCPVDNMDSLEVNHKDENKKNNHLSNLEWVTSKENCNYGTRNKRCAEKNYVKVICVETGIVYNSLTEVKEKLGISKPCLSRCINGKAYTAGKFHWRKYCDE